MNTSPTLIKQVSPRRTIEIHLSDGRVLSGPRCTPLEAFLKSLPEWEDAQIMGAIVNGELRELTYSVEMDSHVVLVNMSDADGARIYRRSLTFLLEAAFEDLFPTATLAVDYSVDSGGFFCQVIGRSPLQQEELARLREYMCDLVETNITFHRRQAPLGEAVDYFQQKGQIEKVRLMKYRQKRYLVLYRLESHQDYHHGYMVPSTSYLRWFDLTPIGEGFVLRFPRRNRPTELLPLPDSTRLLATFRQYGDWLVRLGIRDVGALNDAIQANRIREVILVSEALHEQKIAEIASQIIEQQHQSRIILIAGPSSSGKTTFSKRLAIQLLAQGVSPFALEMDNYFVDREKTPKDENCQYDFEALGALKTDLLSDHLRRLIDGEEVQLPRYNFKSGKGEQGEAVQLGKDQLIILEGIQGLNPHLMPKIPSEKTCRIYVSCLTQLNLDRQNRISTTDTRLVRRIVRDARERGYSAQETIRGWESVRRGEKKHIFPHQENANEMFNSALVYELSALKSLAEPLIRQVPHGTSEYIEAKRLLALLEWFLPVDIDLIPDNSILREFLGGSILRGFKIWENSQDEYILGE